MYFFFQIMIIVLHLFILYRIFFKMCILEVLYHNAAPNPNNQFNILIWYAWTLSECLSFTGTGLWHPGAEFREWASLCWQSLRSCLFGCWHSSWLYRRLSASTWSASTTGTKPYAPACLTPRATSWRYAVILFLSFVFLCATVLFVLRPRCAV